MREQPVRGSAHRVWQRWDEALCEWLSFKARSQTGSPPSSQKAAWPAETPAGPAAPNVHTGKSAWEPGCHRAWGGNPSPKALMSQDVR